LQVFLQLVQSLLTWKQPWCNKRLHCLRKNTKHVRYSVNGIILTNVTEMKKKLFIRKKRARLADLWSAS